MIIKVCGISNDQIAEVDGLDIDFIGRIFHPDSPRDMSTQRAIDSETSQVGVFVDTPVAQIIEACDTHRLSAVQLHGREEIRDMITLKFKGIKIIKAIAVGDEFPKKKISKYAAVSDLLLLDTKGRKAGGNGRRFDWDLLNDYSVECPFLLSGGIGPDHLEEILSIDHDQFAGIDVNSGFESSPGKKDFEILRTFINSLRHG